MTLSPSTHSYDRTLTAPEMSNRLVGTILLQLEQEYGRARVAAACKAAGLPREYLDDPSGWVSNVFHRRLVDELATRLLGLPELPDREHPFWQPWRLAGLEGMRAERLGPFLPVLRTLGSPSSLMRAAPTLVRRFNSTLRFTLLRQSDGQSVVQISPVDQRPEVEPNVGNCWARVGILEGIPTLWGLPAAQVEHHACVFDKRHPAEACVYRVRYVEPPSAALELLTLPLMILSASALGWALGALSISALVVAGLTALGTAAYRVRQRRLEAKSSRELDKLLVDAEQRYHQLWQEGEALRRAYLATRKLSGYLPGPLVEQILRDPDMELRLGGIRDNAAVLFADIVGFSPRCEVASPERVLADLNLYFTAIDDIIFSFGGVIDKRIGDGVMVVFFNHEGEDAQGYGRRALECGLALLEAIPEINAALAEQESPPVSIRVGVGAGPVVRGNVGSPSRMEYTVVGEVVNLAARMESLARPGHLLLPLSQLGDTIAPDMRVVDVRKAVVKGASLPVEVMELGPRLPESAGQAAPLLVEHARG